MPGDKTNSQKHQKEIRQIHLQYSRARHLLLSCGLYTNLSSTLWNEGNQTKLSTGHFLLVLGNNIKMEHGISRVSFILGVTLVEKESRHNLHCQTTQLFRGKCICQGCGNCGNSFELISSSKDYIQWIPSLPTLWENKSSQNKDPYQVSLPEK